MFRLTFRIDYSALPLGRVVLLSDYLILEHQLYLRSLLRNIFGKIRALIVIDPSSCEDRNPRPPRLLLQA